MPGNNTSLRKKHPITAATGESASVPATVLSSSRIPPLGVLPLATPFPAAVSGRAFTCSVREPGPGSCCLYAGRHLGSKRVSPRLLPRATARPWFRRRLNSFRHVNGRGLSSIAHLPGPHLTRSSHAFSHDVHHNGLRPMQLGAVWNLPPQGDPGGPTNLHLSYSTAVSGPPFFLSTFHAHVHNAVHYFRLLGVQAQSGLLT